MNFSLLTGFGLLLLLPATHVAAAAPLSGPHAVAELARPLPLSDVRLTGGPLRRAQRVDADYLLSLEPDRMMAYFRLRAGLTPKAPRLRRLGRRWQKFDRAHRGTLPVSGEPDVCGHGRRAFQRARRLSGARNARSASQKTATARSSRCRMGAKSSLRSRTAIFVQAVSI